MARRKSWAELHNAHLATLDELTQFQRECAEHEDRIAAERVEAEWRAPLQKHPSDFSDSPLFGGPRQGELLEAAPVEPDQQGGLF